MNRRQFVGAVGGICASTCGCLASEDRPRRTTIDAIELENHRRDEGHEFEVDVEDDGRLVLADTYDLGPAGSGESVAVIEDPTLDRGTFTVRVAAAGRSATVRTEDLVTETARCVLIRAYLDSQSLHVEHHAYQQCD